MSRLLSVLSSEPKMRLKETSSQKLKEGSQIIFGSISYGSGSQVLPANLPGAQYHMVPYDEVKTDAVHHFK